MRIAINDWPPLATHFLCLFLGALLANWQAPVEAEAKHLYKRQKATIALPVSWLASQDRFSSDEHDAIGVSLILLDRRSSEPLCRLKPDFMSLLQRHPFPVIEVSTQELGQLSKSLPPASKGPLRLMPLSTAAALPACSGEPKVSYGQL